MMNDREALLDEALRHTHRMLELAATREWQAVVELETRRRGLLEQAFATREPLTESLAERVREILDLDKILLEASMRIRDEVGEELGQLHKGRRGTRAYRASA